MLYFETIKKFLFSFLKTCALFSIILLFYFFNLITEMKSAGNPRFFIESLVSYLTLLLYSLPLISIISTSSFFGLKVPFDRQFLLRIIPIISVINALFLIAFHFVKLPINEMPLHTTHYQTPVIKEGYINPLPDYTVFANKITNSNIQSGLLFNGSAYFIKHSSIKNDRLNISTSRRIDSASITTDEKNISIPMHYSILSIDNTRLGTQGLNIYISLIKQIKATFNTTFSNGGVIFPIISILLLCIGFFSIISGTSLFFNKKDIIALSLSSLLIVSTMFYLSFQFFLSLVELIKLGIASPFGKIFLPSLLVSLLSCIIAFGLLLLKDLLNKKVTGGTR